MKNFLYSLISFLLALFFLCTGLVCLLIPWSTIIRTEIVQFLSHDFLIISIFGLASLLIGSGIAAWIIVGSKKQYYHYHSEKKPILVDEAIIEQYTNSYWEQLFPKTKIPSHVIVKNNKITITVDLPFLPLPQQKQLVKRIQNDFNDIFTTLLGHHPELELFASFEGEPNYTKHQK